MNKYDIVKTLGQGAYGKANLISRKTDKKLFVEKEVRFASLSPKDRESAIQEAKLLASLKHPYIVEYEESFQENGYLYIIMGYADGGDLSTKIEKRGSKLFSEDEILHDFIEIALAIKYIHDRKICHRDLKGQNIFLMKDGTIKLGDFGISKILESTFQACRTQIGTPFYLSPEICNGMEYNTKTDIWSLGCILYELCTLKHAFNASNIAQLMVNIIQARYSPIPSHYSQDLRGLVDKMLTKEPEKRPNINQILNTPYLKKRLNNFLEKDSLDYEMGHTRLHNRKPFATPTVIVGKDQSSQNSKPAKNVKQTNQVDQEYEEYVEQQKQIQLKKAALKKKEAELAARERALQEYDEAENRARLYQEQRRELNDNKARMQQELSGSSMKLVLQSQFPEDDYENNNFRRNKNQNSYEQQAKDNYLEQMRMARANRERLKREEFQGTEMKRALMDSQYSDDNYYQKNKNDKRKGGDDYEALNAYMRQQRHEAAENKKRLEEAQRGSAAKAALAQSDEQIYRQKAFQSDYEYDYSDYYSDYSDNKHLQLQSKQKQEDDKEALNEYMRQIRHEREANKLRIMEALKKAQDEDLLSQKRPLSDSKDERAPKKEKKVEMSQSERNEFMREERHRRRENKARIEQMGQINMEQLIAEAEAEQRMNNPKRKTKFEKDQVQLQLESNLKTKCDNGYLEQVYSCKYPLQSVKFNIQKSESNKYVDINSDGIASYETIQKGLPNEPDRVKFRTFISFPEKGLYKVELNINGRNELVYDVDVQSKSSQYVPIDSTPFNMYKFVPISPKTMLTTVTEGVGYFRFAASRELTAFFDIGKIDGKTFDYDNRKKFGGSKVAAIKLEIPFDNERWEYHCVATFPFDGRWSVSISMKDNKNNLFSDVTKFFYDVTGADPKRTKVSPLKFMYNGRKLAPDNKVKITQKQIDELPAPPQKEKQVMNDLKEIVKQDNSKVKCENKNKKEETNNNNNSNNNASLDDKNENKDTQQSKCCLLI